MKNYYRILGVNPDATAEQIKQAYRQRAKELHPDVKTQINRWECHRRFQLLSEAYENLKSTERRVRYDQLLRHYRLSNPKKKMTTHSNDNHNPNRPPGLRGFFSWLLEPFFSDDKTG